MSLTSVNYILFLLASVVIFYLVPKAWKVSVIFLASIGFYLFFSPEKLLILMAYIWLIFLLGKNIQKHEKLRLFLLITGVGLSVGILLAFRLLPHPAMGSLMPLGLSYCVLQSISYLVCIKKGRLSPVSNPVDLFAYLLFFPKIMAGPVEDPVSFLDELRSSDYDRQNIYRGLPLIAIGMAKKLAVAEVLTPAVTFTFDTLSCTDGMTACLGIIAYSFVILFDFSGYTDIAMGSASLFGIRLTENFDNPYLSMGIVDFWKKWHISLTSWLRTYVYFSLGGSRVTKEERFMNIMTIFMLSGLWHGTTLGFLTWGMYHGILQIIEIVLVERLGLKGRKVPRVLRPVLCIFTFILVAVGWVFFRASTLDDAFKVLGTLFTPWHSFSYAVTALGLSLPFILFAAAAILVTTIMKSVVVRHKQSLISSCFIAGIAALIAVSGVILLGSSTGSSFIYFNF